MSKDLNGYIEFCLKTLQKKVISNSQKLFRTTKDRPKEFGLKHSQPFNIINLFNEDDQELFGCKRFLILNSKHQFLDSSDSVPKYELIPGYDTEYTFDNIFSWELWPFKIYWILSKLEFRCLGCHYLTRDRISYNKKNKTICRYWMKCRKENTRFYVLINLHYRNVQIAIHWNPRGNSYTEKNINAPCEHKLYQYILDLNHLETILKSNRVLTSEIKHLEQIFDRNSIPISTKYKIWL